MTWELEKLGSLCQIEIGKTPLRRNNEYWKNGNFPFLSISDMGDEKYITQTKEKITEKAVKEQNCRLVPADTVLMSFKLSIGVVGINKFPLFTNEAIAAFSIESEKKLLKNYLFWVLQSIDYDIYVDRAAKGKTLNKSKLHNIQIPLPPVDEQKRIATKLDQADALRRKREQSLSHLDDLILSQFYEMFLQLENKTRLGDLVEVVTKGTTPTTLGSDYVDEGIPFIRAQNLLNRQLKYQNDVLYIDKKTHEIMSRSQLHPGDVLLTIAGTVGRVALVPVGAPPLNCNQAVALIRLREKLLPEYVMYWLLTQDAIRQMLDAKVTMTISNLSLTQIKNLEIPVPDIKLQNDFKIFLRKHQTLYEHNLKSLKKINDLFYSLQHSAFSGQL